MEHQTLELLDGLGVTTLGSMRTSVGSLSGGQRQSVAIARSLLGEPRLVILDEPTAALGVIQTQQVLELIDHLKARGLGVIVISHNLRNVFHIADRIVVLRLGRRAASFDRRYTSRAEVVAAIRGKPGSAAANADVMAWARAHHDWSDQSLALLAASAVRRVRDASELRDLWAETDELETWLATLDDLITRLS